MNRAARFLLLALAPGWLAAPAAAITPAQPSAPGLRSVEDPTGRARELLRAGSPGEAVELLRAHLARASDDPEARQVLAEAYLAQGQPDPAAHHLALAVAQLEGRGDQRAARQALSALRRADPLSARRERLLQDITTRLFEAAGRLVEHGHPERALELLERVLPIAAGREADAARALHERVRASFERVDLDASGGAEPVEGFLPVRLHESRHYRFEANLELEVLERLGRTMDALHAYYVDIFFDGDGRKARAPKALVRIHPSWDSLAEEWSGGRDSAPAGWWSPGENRVVCYDTRASAGSLEGMLATLFHEASHQFTSLLARGGSIPSWLNEGTASFFEGAVAMADDRVLWPDAALGRLQSLAFALEYPRADTPKLEAVLGWEQPGSYPGPYYAWGWGLVYFLQQYEDPDTLAYVYRPLYARYRERILGGGRGSAALFAEVFLGPDSPLGHRDLSDFERDWRRWILEEVRPLHLAPPERRRFLRLERAQLYLDAAELAAARRRPAVGEAELLTRALGHLEYVRRDLDGPERPDGELLLRLAEILVRLNRGPSAAPLLEQVLDLADQGAFALDEERYAEGERRLRQLDAPNWALRSARSRSAALTRNARRLLGDYLAREPALTLRSYTFAAEVAGALGDAELAARAAELRLAARDSGLLLGRVEPLAARRRDAWYTLVVAEPRRFEAERGRILLDAVRYQPMVTPELDPGRDYELRGRLERGGEVFMGAAHGFVVAAQRDGEAWLAGLTDEGHVGVWKIRRLGGGGARTDRLATLELDPPVGADEVVELAVGVRDGARLSVRVGDRAPLAYDLAEPPPARRHVGVFVKDGVLVLSDAVLEVLP